MSDTTDRTGVTGTAVDFSKMNWQDLLGQAPVFICVVDRDGTIVSLNRAFPGFDKESSLGRKLQSFAQAEDREAVAEAIATVFDSGKPSSFSARGPDADGIVRDFAACLTPAEWKGEVVGVTVFAQDVTEQRRSADRSARQKATLESVFRAAPVGVGITVNRIITRANERLSSLLGYSCEELTGMDARRLYPDEAEYERVGREKYAEIERRRVGTIETKWQRKDGEVIDVLLSSSPIDASDLEKGVVFTALDITESRRSREAIECSERRLREVTGSIPGAVFQFVMRPDGSVQVPFMSKGAVEVLEQPLDILHDEDELFNTVHPDDIDGVWESIQESARTLHQWSHRFRIQPGDGRIKWIRGRSSPSRREDGAIVWNGVLLDVTGQYVARQELQQSRQLLAAAEKIARYGSWEWDLDTHEVTWSENLFELYGRDSGKGTPSEEHWLDNAHPEDRDRLHRAVQDALADEKPYSIEWRQLREDTGEMRHMYAEGEVLRDDSGRPVRMVGVARDITEQREAERELRFKARMLDSVNDAVIATDAEGRITYWNRGAERLYGWQSREVEGRNIIEVTPTDQTHDDANRIMERLIAGHKWSGEFRVCDKSGREFRIQVTDWPILDDEGRLIGVIGISNDVTEQRAAEEALRYRLSFERLISAISTDLIALETDEIDAHIDTALGEVGKFAGVDRAYTFLFSEDGERMSIAHEWCADGVAGNAGRLQDVPLGTFPWVIERLQRFESVVIPRVADLPDEAAAERESMLAGDTRSLICVPIYQSDKLMGLLGLDMVGRTRDWSEDFDTLLRMVADSLANALERRRAEAALRRSEERFRAVFETARDAIFIKDAERRYVAVNPAMEKLFDQPAEALAGKTDADLFGPDVARNIELEDRSVLEGGVVEGEQIKPVLGESHVFDVIKVPMRDNQKRIVGICGIARDITQKLKMEEELARADKLDSIGLLAGGIAHDFNNILTGVVGNMSLAKAEVDEESTLLELLDEADRALVRTSDLTRQLLTFSRGGAPVKRTASLSELIHDSAEFCLRGSNVRCQYQLDEGLKNVEVDVGQISQVINNLVINADHAMPRGGSLIISAHNVVIRPGTPKPLKPGEYVMLEITDEGTGIPENLLPKIFDPFFTTKQRGNGLGLASTYSIVHKHEGHIECSSTLGKGTTFRVYLPASDKHIESISTRPSETASGSGRVLVMDDEPVVRDIAEKSLRKWGYEVEFACDGAEALTRYRQALERGRRFDAVILDLTVPGGMGGREAVSHLLQIDSEVRAIVCSGYSNDPALADYEGAGFVGIVSKPFKPGELAQAVQNAIGEKRDRPQT